MTKYLFPVLVLLLFSCTQKEETVDFSDLAPNSSYKEHKDDTAKAVLTNERPEQSTFLRIVDTLFADSRWVKWDTLLFPDRFGPKTQEKWFAVGSADSLVLLKYEFNDSLKTTNAFFNWIDCFGPKCKSYAIGGNIRIPQRNGLIFVGEKQLIIVEGNKKIDEKVIRSILHKDPKKEKWIYVVTVPKSGKTVWKRVEKGEDKPIIREDENS